MTNEQAVTEASITSLKSAAVQQILSADQAINVVLTNYFNNTYAPDFVLEWKDENLRRPVYLRTTANVGYLAEDVALADDEGSILMPLGDVLEQAAADAAIPPLQEEARRRKILVAEPSSFGRLGSNQDKVPVRALASRAFVRGGSGVVDEGAADRYATSIANGFEGAQVGNAGATQDALEEASTVLNRKRANGVENFLHAVWLGAGARDADFPSGKVLSTRLDGSGLSLLIDTIELDDDPFWERIGKNVRLLDLIGLDPRSDNQNFQRLVRASVPHLKARVCRLVGDGNEHSGGHRSWFVEKAALGLDFDNLRILIAESPIADLSTEGLDSQPSLDVLRSRASAHRIDVTSLELGAGDRRMQYASATDESVLEDPALIEFARVSRESRVLSARSSYEDAAIVIDFKSSTARTGSAAKYSLHDLVAGSVPLFTTMTEGRLEELRSLLTAETQNTTH